MFNPLGRLYHYAHDGRDFQATGTGKIFAREAPEKGTLILTK
jgi:hypothetical protein